MIGAFNTLKGAHDDQYSGGDSDRSGDTGRQAWMKSDTNIFIKCFHGTIKHPAVPISSKITATDTLKLPAIFSIMTSANLAAGGSKIQSYFMEWWKMEFSITRVLSACLPAGANLLNRNGSELALQICKASFHLSVTHYIIFTQASCVPPENSHATLDAFQVISDLCLQVTQDNQLSNQEC